VVAMCLQKEYGLGGNADGLSRVGALKLIYSLASVAVAEDVSYVLELDFPRRSDCSGISRDQPF